MPVVTPEASMSCASSSVAAWIAVLIRDTSLAAPLASDFAGCCVASAPFAVPDDDSDDVDDVDCDALFAADCADASWVWSVLIVVSSCWIAVAVLLELLLPPPPPPCPPWPEDFFVPDVLLVEDVLEEEVDEEDEELADAVDPLAAGLTGAAVMAVLCCVAALDTAEIDIGQTPCTATARTAEKGQSLSA